MSSVKKNVLFSSILTTANYIFPLLTFPYVSRVLGVANIGLCNFVDSIINIFILLSMMGTSILGIREIAIVKENKQKRSNTFFSILALNLVTTIVVLVALILITIFYEPLRAHTDMMIVGGLKLCFNIFLVEWFFKGLEDFKYITIRTIIVRCVYVASVFIFVKSDKDYTIYYALSCIILVINAAINMVYASKFITFKATIKQCRSFVKPFFTLGFYAILTSAYTTFNVTFLGIVAGDVEVGYYTTATKLYSIILSLFTAFTGVMLPRMSSLITEGKIDEFKKYTNNSIDLLFSFSIPLVILSSIAAPQIVMAISGPGYEGAILPMRIVMPLMLIIGYEQILVIQMLMPLKEDRAILRNSAIVAVISICLNLLLVQHFKSIGSAMIWVVSELVILVLSQIKIAKLIGLEFPYKRLIKALSLNIPLFILVLIVSITVSNTYKSLAISCVITLIYSMFITLKFYPTGIIANTSKQLISRIKK